MCKGRWLSSFQREFEMCKAHTYSDNGLDFTAGRKKFGAETFEGVKHILSPLSPSLSFVYRFSLFYFFGSLL